MQADVSQAPIRPRRLAPHLAAIAVPIEETLVEAERVLEQPRDHALGMRQLGEPRLGDACQHLVHSVARGAQVRFRALAQRNLAGERIAKLTVVPEAADEQRERGQQRDRNQRRGHRLAP